MLPCCGGFLLRWGGFFPDAGKRGTCEKEVDAFLQDCYDKYIQNLMKDNMLFAGIAVCIDGLAVFGA